MLIFEHVARFQKLWQVHYFVDLEVHILSQVGLEVQISWQAQYFVDLEV